MQKLVVNITTGEQSLVNMTQQDIDSLPTITPQGVPTEVSRFQAKAALALTNKLEEVNTLVSSSNDPVIKLAWSEATVFRRDSPSINALASAVGLTQQDLDQLFITASEIVA